MNSCEHLAKVRPQVTHYCRLSLATVLLNWPHQQDLDLWEREVLIPIFRPWRPNFTASQQRVVMQHVDKWVAVTLAKMNFFFGWGCRTLRIFGQLLQQHSKLMFWGPLVTAGRRVSNTGLVKRNTEDMQSGNPWRPILMRWSICGLSKLANVY